MYTKDINEHLIDIATATFDSVRQIRKQLILVNNALISGPLKIVLICDVF